MCFAFYCNVKTMETSIWTEELLISFGMGGKGLALFMVTVASLSRMEKPEERTILISWLKPFDKTVKLK